jgi:hypothetical protein
MECEFCTGQPAVVSNVPTLLGRRSLCLACLRVWGRGPSTAPAAARKRKRQPAAPARPRDLPGQLLFPFAQEAPR